MQIKEKTEIKAVETKGVEVGITVKEVIKEGLIAFDFEYKNEPWEFSTENVVEGDKVVMALAKVNGKWQEMPLSHVKLVVFCSSAEAMGW